jgi:hypothetical protein
MNSPETEFVNILGSNEKAEAPASVSSHSLPEKLPILGLSDVVIFPGAIVPLLVETGPSLKLVDDLVAGDRLLGAVLQTNPDIADPAPADLHAVGCVRAPQQDGEDPRWHRAHFGGRAVAHPVQLVFAAGTLSARQF